MNIACKDIAVLNIQNALNNHEKTLQTKYNELKKASSDNKLLIDVVKDYARHLQYIKKQKKQQYDGLKKISDYIDRISQNTKQTESMLKQTKYDQKEIMSEMNRLRKEINKIIVDDDDDDDDVDVINASDVVSADDDVASDSDVDNVATSSE